MRGNDSGVLGKWFLLSRIRLRHFDSFDKGGVTDVNVKIKGKHKKVTITNHCTRNWRMATFSLFACAFYFFDCHTFEESIALLSILLN